MVRQLLTPRLRDSRANGSGFTLTELMVSIVIFALLMGAVTNALIAYIRGNINLEFNQAMRNDIGRLSYLIETEIKEGSAISTGVAVDCAPGSTSLFTITVPQQGSTGATLPTSAIHYYSTGTGSTASLNRCGPPISNDGNLNFSGTRAASVVSTNTTLDVISSTSTSVTYTITLRDPAAGRAFSLGNSITNRVSATQIN